MSEMTIDEGLVQMVAMAEQLIVDGIDLEHLRRITRQATRRPRPHNNAQTKEKTGEALYVDFVSTLTAATVRAGAKRGALETFLSDYLHLRGH